MACVMPFFKFVVWELLRVLFFLSLVSLQAGYSGVIMLAGVGESCRRSG